MRSSEGTISATLKDAIRGSGLPLLTIEQRTGVKRATVLRFMRGDADIRLATADTLAAFFGVRVSKTKDR